MMLINALIPPQEWKKTKIVALARQKDNKGSLVNLLFAILYLLCKETILWNSSYECKIFFVKFMDGRLCN